MPTHMTTWLTSTSDGVAIACSILRAADDPAAASWCSASVPDVPTTAQAGAWLPKCEAPLLGEANVKTADANKMNATTKARPGSSFGPPDDMDIAPEADEDPIGYQYIKSMAKFMMAWISA